MAIWLCCYKCSWGDISIIIIGANCILLYHRISRIYWTGYLSVVYRLSFRLGFTDRKIRYNEKPKVDSSFPLVSSQNSKENSLVCCPDVLREPMTRFTGRQLFSFPSMLMMNQMNTGPGQINRKRMETWMVWLTNTVTTFISVTPL